jgi:hypothetical protein
MALSGASCVVILLGLVQPVSSVQCVEKCYANSYGCLMHGNRRKCGVDLGGEGVTEHKIKACRGREVKLHLLLISALDGSEWSDIRPCRSSPGQ